MRNLCLSLQLESLADQGTREFNLCGPFRRVLRSVKDKREIEHLKLSRNLFTTAIVLLATCLPGAAQTQTASREAALARSEVHQSGRGSAYLLESADHGISRLF